MDDKELLEKVKYLTQNCAFPVKRDIFVEELAELLEVTNSPRLCITKWSSEKVLEEFADVYLMLWQMVIYLGEDDIEDYICNYEHFGEMKYEIVSMTFLQKAMHAIWTISKMRRDPNIPKNFVEFRGVIYLLCDHIQANMVNLRLQKANDILTKIREIVVYKVERQMKRIEEEMAPEIYCKNDVVMCEEEKMAHHVCRNTFYGMTVKNLGFAGDAEKAVNEIKEAIKNGSNSAETSD